MKAKLTLISSFFLLSIISYGQSEYYAKRANHYSGIGWYSSALSELIKGEASGEVASAELLALVYFSDKYAPVNKTSIEKVKMLIEKWYTKSNRICNLGIALFAPDKEWDDLKLVIGFYTMESEVRKIAGDLKLQRNMHMAIKYAKQLAKKNDEPYNLIMTTAHYYGWYGYEKNLNTALQYAVKLGKSWDYKRLYLVIGEELVDKYVYGKDGYKKSLEKAAQTVWNNGLYYDYLFKRIQNIQDYFKAYNYFNTRVKDPKPFFEAYYGEVFGPKRDSLFVDFLKNSSSYNKYNEELKRALDEHAIEYYSSKERIPRSIDVLNFYNSYPNPAVPDSIKKVYTKKIDDRLKKKIWGSAIKTKPDSLISLIKEYNYVEHLSTVGVINKPLSAGENFYTTVKGHLEGYRKVISDMISNNLVYSQDKSIKALAIFEEFYKTYKTSQLPNFNDTLAKQFSDFSIFLADARSAITTREQKDVELFLNKYSNEQDTECVKIVNSLKIVEARLLAMTLTSKSKAEEIDKVLILSSSNKFFYDQLAQFTQKKCLKKKDRYDKKYINYTIESLLEDVYNYSIL